MCSRKKDCDNMDLTKIKNTLKRMGKRVFVCYYKDFKTRNIETCSAALAQEHFSAKSLKTRVSCGIRLFDRQQNIEALQIVIDSPRVAEEFRTSAKKLISKELANKNQ